MLKRFFIFVWCKKTGVVTSSDRADDSVMSASEIFITRLGASDNILNLVGRSLANYCDIGYIIDTLAAAGSAQQDIFGQHVSHMASDSLACGQCSAARATLVEINDLMENLHRNTTISSSEDDDDDLPRQA